MVRSRRALVAVPVARPVLDHSDAVEGLPGFPLPLLVVGAPREVVVAHREAKPAITPAALRLLIIYNAIDSNVNKTIQR